MKQPTALWDDPFNLDFEEDLLKELNTLPGLYDNSDVSLGLDLMEDPLLMNASNTGKYGYEIFSIYDFLRQSLKKKTSMDGLKWRDLVMGRWWLVNFKVSAVRCHKGFMC